MMARCVSAILCAFLVASEAPAQITTSALLDTIQHAGFNFFWNEANPVNGLIKDRNTSGSACSIASVGFGLTVISIGVDHGWVSRQAARDRVLTTLKTFWYGPQGSGDAYIGNYGLFYHFLDMNTSRRTWNSELSTIDTGLLLAGIIDAKQYFNRSDSMETLIRSLADSIYYRMNWDLMRNYNSGIMMGWMPGRGFSDANGNPYPQWRGYNEASIMYILAMGSPTYPVDAEGWRYWTSGYVWANYYGFQYVSFAPLFGHQYTQCWLDLRSVADEYMRNHGITYFENSRRATYAQRAYSIDNPLHRTGYSDSLWGMTASDIQGGYLARGAPPAENDDGTIAPTAPVSSIAFASEIVLPVIWNMWNNYRDRLWMQYGFRDAFNLALDWWDTDVIGIDQGPMVIMIENYRTGKVWNRFTQNADVQRGLQVAGFQTVTGVREPGRPYNYELQQNYPNPFNPTTAIRYQLASASNVRLVVFDVLGREVKRLVDGVQSAGRHIVAFEGTGLSSGCYLYRLSAIPTGGGGPDASSGTAYVAQKKMLLVR